MSATTLDGREAAAAYIKGAMAERRWNAADLAEHAGIDPGTVGDFLNGRRWPSLRSRSAMEAATGLDVGTLERIRRDAEGGSLRKVAEAVGTPSEGPPTVEVHDRPARTEGAAGVVTLKVAALGVEASVTYTDDEDRARALRELMAAMGLDRGGSIDEGGATGVRVPNGGA